MKDILGNSRFVVQFEEVEGKKNSISVETLKEDNSNSTKIPLEGNDADD